MVESITHLTFDCYGTLIDWRNGIETHLGGLLREMGLPASVRVYPTYVKLEAEEEGTYKKYREVLEDTALKVARHFGISLGRNEATDFAGSVPSWTPFDDTVNALRTLGSLGLKRIILSNIDSDTLRETIRRNKLDVDGFITAEELGSYKPALGHWKAFFERYHVEKSRTLHVAQSIYHDIIPASGLGIATAWINRYGEGEPSGVKPSYSFRTLAALSSLFV